MSERKVFGRIEIARGEDGFSYWIEMRKEGIFVRRKHCQPEFKIDFKEILRLGKLQPELFVTEVK